ncbi:MAG: Fic family protein [Nanoarchaeota archaeon]|nr:Fic family protein [Nanoarchaeota archaeon]
MSIVKRKKRNSEYFYIKHSYRRNGKVITKEKYLGKKIPPNIDEIKRKLNKELYEKLGKIQENFQKEWKKYPESIKEKIKEDIAIAFTYNTNAIEGSTITLDDAREIIKDKIAPRKPLRDIKETEAHSKVFLDMLDKNEKITNKLMLKWHQDVFGQTKSDISGKYRDYRVRVGDYVPPDWQDVSSLMNKLVRFVNNSKLNSVELAARAHYRFESIHPFGDGNGRIGRLLLNFILWHNKYPMLIIEYKKRRSYYKALQKGEDGFVSYFFRRYLAVNKNRIE